jgi:hypothetical protein
MDKKLIEEKFRRVGARVRVTETPIGRLTVDVKRDGKGEYFDLKVARQTINGAGVWVDAIDVRPRERHLLLMAADDAGGAPAKSGGKQKFLCGHDERSWFVAAVPEKRPAANVREAFDALKPVDVQQALSRFKVRNRDRNLRRNEAFVRQGEWFFLPRPDVIVPDALVLRNEPIRRGNGKPHWVEFLSRTRGEVVYVNREGEAMTDWQYQRRLKELPRLKGHWTVQRRNMRVLAKGRVSHPDHKTIVLPCWHEVVMNTESQSVAMRWVAFID